MINIHNIIKNVYDNLKNKLPLLKKTIKIQTTDSEGIISFENDIFVAKYILMEIIKNIKLCFYSEISVSSSSSDINKTIIIEPCKKDNDD